ncbi:MAG: hypothetical protein K6D96_01250 [Acetatifactor sp.]|nr:hypothetical protein [Acetatifactor sp.]
MFKRLGLLGLIMVMSISTFAGCINEDNETDPAGNESDYVISDGQEDEKKDDEKPVSLKKSDYMMMPVKAILMAYYCEEDYHYDATDPVSFWKTMDYFAMFYGNPVGADEDGREVYDEFTIKQYASVLFGKGGTLAEMPSDEKNWEYDPNKKMYIRETRVSSEEDVVIYDTYSPGNGYIYVLSYVDRKDPEDIVFYNVVLNSNKYENRGDFKMSAVYSQPLEYRNISLEDGTYYTSTKAIAKIEDTDLILTCRIDQYDNLYQNYKFEGKNNFPVTLINGNERYGDILSAEEFNEIFNAHHSLGDFNMRIEMEDDRVDSVIVAEQTYE